jgi:hypothetical protein
MLKINSLVSSVLKTANETLSKISFQQVREIKTKGEYFRRFGYEYDKIYKGGEKNTMKNFLSKKNKVRVKYKR